MYESIFASPVEKLSSDWLRAAEGAGEGAVVSEMSVPEKGRTAGVAAGATLRAVSFSLLFCAAGLGRAGVWTRTPSLVSKVSKREPRLACGAGRRGEQRVGAHRRGIFLKLGGRPG